MKSTEVAQRVIECIKTQPGSKKVEICEAVKVSVDQFQAAMPYITRACVRIRLKWHVKEQAAPE